MVSAMPPTSGVAAGELASGSGWPGRRWRQSSVHRQRRCTVIQARPVVFHAAVVDLDAHGSDIESDVRLLGTRVFGFCVEGPPSTLRCPCRWLGLGGHGDERAPVSRAKREGPVTEPVEHHSGGRHWRWARARDPWRLRSRCKAAQIVRTRRTGSGPIFDLGGCVGVVVRLVATRRARYRVPRSLRVILRQWRMSRLRWGFGAGVRSWARCWIDVGAARLWSRILLWLRSCGRWNVPALVISGVCVSAMSAATGRRCRRVWRRATGWSGWRWPRRSTGGWTPRPRRWWISGWRSWGGSRPMSEA